MSEQSCIAELIAEKHNAASQARNSAVVSEELLAKAEAALAIYPRSPKLWCIRGDFIQLSEGSSYTLEDARVSYEHALSIDPDFAEAHESLGYYYDVVAIDLAKAEAAFVSAVKLGGGPHSYAGLARIQAERGRDRAEILRILDSCPFPDSPVIEEMREEIQIGTWKPR